MLKSIRYGIILLFISPLISNAQQNNELLLIEPTDTIINGTPGMRAVERDSPVYRFTDSIVRISFAGEAVRLYYLVQQYLVNTRELTKTHPAYLGVTHQQGGFARKGFYLQEPDGTYSDETSAHYVDLTASNITALPGQLESITQLYPHELAHILLEMLSSSGSAEMNSFNVNMHYFSIITDYNTAFNEGFAEHIENVSVLNEPESSIKKGKYASMQDVLPFLMMHIRGFKHDFIWPFRVGYYKAAMLIWYQQFENYKRYAHAVSDNAAFLNSCPELGSTRSMITWRNTGIEQDPEKRKNLVQRMATEGFVSTFFTHLAMSDLPKIYRPAAFYKDFLADTLKQINPEQEFSPLQNLFLKYFYVCHHYVNLKKSSAAQLMDFIDGYMIEFPDEACIIKRVYREVSGEDYSGELPPPLWMLVKNYKYPVMVMDPYGATSIPFYTFDLNAAEPEDLMTIDGIDRESAEKIIAFRNRSGLFHSMDELNNIPGLGKSVTDKLLANKMDETIFNAVPENKLNVSDLIISLLSHLFKNGMMWFLLIGLALIGLNYKDKSKKELIFKLIKYLALWIIFLCAGLAAVVIQVNPYVFLLVFLLLTLSIAAFILRKNKPAFRKNLLISLLMAALLFYFII